jgi:hypothetical protein
LFIMFGRRHARLGDLAAGTVVAVERAPFLEQVAARMGTAGQIESWQHMRQRAHALNARRGSSVDDALAVVDDYRGMARALGIAHGKPETLTRPATEHLEAAYAELHGSVQRPPRRVLLGLWSL